MISFRYQNTTYYLLTAADGQSLLTFDVRACKIGSGLTTSWTRIKELGEKHAYPSQAEGFKVGSV